jgi:hypothetical protein
MGYLIKNITHLLNKRHPLVNKQVDITLSNGSIIALNIDQTIYIETNFIPVSVRKLQVMGAISIDYSDGIFAVKETVVNNDITPLPSEVSIEEPIEDSEEIAGQIADVIEDESTPEEPTTDENRKPNKRGKK